MEENTYEEKLKEQVQQRKKALHRHVQKGDVGVEKHMDGMMGRDWEWMRHTEQDRERKEVMKDIDGS